jgi:hypothetical protein
MSHYRRNPIFLFKCDIVKLLSLMAVKGKIKKKAYGLEKDPHQSINEAQIQEGYHLTASMVPLY